jgi:methylenetetrahydrofolate dehydrogenase (NAD+)
MASSTAPSTCKVILANTIAKSLSAEVQAELKQLGRAPQLHGFLANKDPAARMYADWTGKTCKEK